MSDGYNHLAGELTPDGHVLQQRIYFEDTDFTGIVYHARYLHFMERGRTDFIRLLGVHHSELVGGDHGEQLAFAVRHMDLTFYKPARIDDVVEIHTRPGTLKGARLVLEQSVQCQGEVLLKGMVTVVLITNEGRPRRFPDSVVRLLGL